MGQDLRCHVFRYLRLCCIGVWVFSVSCAAEPTITEVIPPLTDEGRHLLERLEGGWSLQITVSSTCPSEWRRELPAGQVVFAVEDGALRIQERGSSLTLFTLYPVDDTTLVYSATASLVGCTARERAELVMETLTSSTSSGTFQVDITRDNAAACDAWFDDEGLPESCTTTTTYQGLRLGAALGS